MMYQVPREYRVFATTADLLYSDQQKRLQILAEEQRLAMQKNAGRPTFQIPADYHKFNKLIGMPIHPATNQPAFRLRTQQYMLNEEVERRRTAWIIVDKSKKIGITDGVLRVIAHKVFGKYLGPKSMPGEVMLVAGNRWEHVVGDPTRVMPRLQAMLEPFEQYGYIIEKDSKHIVIEYGGQRCIVNAYPSEPKAFIGKPNVKCIFLDEAAFTGLINDSEVFSALIANLSQTMGDFFMISTPHGRRGFFFNIWDKKPRNWIPKLWTYEVGLMWEHGNLMTDGPGSPTPMPPDPPLFTQEFIEAQRDNPEVNFAQDYEGQFTTTSDAIFSEQELQDIFV